MIMTEILDQDLALSLVNNALGAKEVAIDTETDYKEGKHRDIRDGTGKALGASLAYRNSSGMNALFLPFRYTDVNYDRGQFLPVLQKILNHKKCIFHNAKFDLVSLKTLGLDTDNTSFYDTMIMAHLVDENNPIAGKKLDALAKYYLGNEGKHFTPEIKLMSKKIGWDKIPAAILADYAATDAVLTLELLEYLKPKMDEEKLWETWEHKEKFLRLLMSMESKGVAIDTRLANQQNEIGSTRMEEIVKELNGFRPSSPKALHRLLCDQLGLPEIFHPKTGNVTFNKDAMEEYDLILDRMNNPIAKLILEYRGWSKAVTGYYRPYVARLSPDGRLRASYKLHGTRTGRLSCAEPNLHQIPRETEKPWNKYVKKVIVAKPGYLLVEIDYSQLEFRLGTVYAQEPHLIKIFNEDRDIFQEMADALEQTRQDTKTMVYSIQYGAGVNRIKNVFGISPIEARNRINNYYSTYPKFKEQMRLVESMAYRRGKVPFWSGRFRHFDNPKAQGYKAFNSVIQGGAADIVEHVMLKLYNYNIPGTDILLTVHDSIVFEIENRVVDKVVPIIMKVMVDIDSIIGQETGVKFAVEAKRWGKQMK